MLAPESDPSIVTEEDSGLYELVPEYAPSRATISEVYIPGSVIRRALQPDAHVPEKVRDLYKPLWLIGSVLVLLTVAAAVVAPWIRP
jgi:hypothetical protein